MGFYLRRVFPWLVDRALTRDGMAELRQALLADVRGDVLEIGFGTGLNLPHYPPDVRTLSAVEPNEGMLARARERIVTSGRGVTAVALRGDRIDAPDRSFDSAVSTWTMCSIADLPGALREIHRVLRPGGRLLFLEHGLAPDRRVATLQRALTPIQKRLAGGCHLDRDIGAFVRESPLEIESLDTFYLPNKVRIGAFMYRGVARRG